MAGDLEGKTLTTQYRERGDWNPLWDELEEIDPEFLEAYLQFRHVSYGRNNLSRKFKELILIAVNASTTHLYAPGVRRHIHNALREGASYAEIFEVIQLVSIIGVHACNIALPILIEESEKYNNGSA